MPSKRVAQLRRSFGRNQRRGVTLPLPDLTAYDWPTSLVPVHFLLPPEMFCTDGELDTDWFMGIDVDFRHARFG